MWFWSFFRWIIHIWGRFVVWLFLVDLQLLITGLLKWKYASYSFVFFYLRHFYKKCKMCKLDFSVCMMIFALVTWWDIHNYTWTWLDVIAYPLMSERPLHTRKSTWISLSNWSWGKPSVRNPSRIFDSNQLNSKSSLLQSHFSAGQALTTLIFTGSTKTPP